MLLPLLLLRCTARRRRPHAVAVPPPPGAAHGGRRARGAAPRRRRCRHRRRARRRRLGSSPADPTAVGLCSREPMFVFGRSASRRLWSAALVVGRVLRGFRVSNSWVVTTTEWEQHVAKDYRDPPPARLLDVGEIRLWSFYRALIAEFVATLLFLYVTVATIIGHIKLRDDDCGGVGLLGIAWAFGGMIFILVYCTAGISGGHINPAVTFGLFLARKVSLLRAFFYMVAQCLGAVCGVALVKAVMKEPYTTLGGGVNMVASGYTNKTAFRAEVIGTFVLVYTVFSATDPKRNARDSHVPVLAPLPIGFAVFVVHLATIPITGTGINPARSFGAAVIYNQNKAWEDQWIFWVGPFVGALVAAVFHQYILRAAAVKAWGSFRSNPGN